MTREQIAEEIYNTPSIDDMWLVSIVWKDKLGIINTTYCYFYDRCCAEYFFSDFVKDGRPYYARCCGDFYMNKIKEILED